MPTLTLPSCSERLAALLGVAAARALALGRPVLLSVVERAQATDPLEMLQRWETLAGADMSARMYWARPAAGIATASLGEVAAIQASSTDRFAAIRGAVARLLDHAIVEAPADAPECTGPSLVGGLSFDPAGPLGGAWRDFPSAHFILPRIQVTRAGDDTWITASVLVDADGDPDMDPADIGQLCDTLFGVPASAGVPTGPRSPDAILFDDDTPPAVWQQLVADAVSTIESGAFDKVVLARARRCKADGPIDVHQVLRRLATGSPDCFVFGVWVGASAFVGASPERLVRLDGRDVEASSLAGSAPRGATPDEDRALAASLTTSAKDLAEHALVRNALVDALDGMCDHVQSDDAPSLFTLPHVHHLHTAVRARLRNGRTLVDLVEALHPTPAVGGAPRHAALAWIRGNEPLDRGWYAGPVGWIGRGRGEFAVALRSAVVRRTEAMLFAGCGIVAGSVPADEYSETLLKLRPMEQAIAPDEDSAG